jgi:hypothetical protein
MERNFEPDSPLEEGAHLLTQVPEPELVVDAAETDREGGDLRPPKEAAVALLAEWIRKERAAHRAALAEYDQTPPSAHFN